MSTQYWCRKVRPGNRIWNGFYIAPLARASQDQWEGPYSAEEAIAIMQKDHGRRRPRAYYVSGCRLSKTVGVVCGSAHELAMVPFKDWAWLECMDQQIRNKRN